MNKLEKMLRGVPVDEIRQVASQEEQEVTINILYGEYGGEVPEIWIYTNSATVMKRILRKGYIPTDVEYLQSRPDMPFSMEFKLPISELGQFVRTGIFQRG